MWYSSLGIVVRRTSGEFIRSAMIYDNIIVLDERWLKNLILLIENKGNKHRQDIMPDENWARKEKPLK